MCVLVSMHVCTRMHMCVHTHASALPLSLCFFLCHLTHINLPSMLTDIPSPQDHRVHLHCSCMIPSGIRRCLAQSRGSEKLRDWPKITRYKVVLSLWDLFLPWPFTLRLQRTWGGHVVLHLEKGLVTALLQGGYSSGVTGPMQWDPIYAEQSVTHLQGAFPVGEVKVQSAEGQRNGAVWGGKPEGVGAEQTERAYKMCQASSDALYSTACLSWGCSSRLLTHLKRALQPREGVHLAGDTQRQRRGG